MPSIFLFDIDGTLIRTGGAGRMALQRAFGQLYQRADACNPIHFGGMTDPAIVAGGLRNIGQEATPQRIREVLDTYLCFLPNAVAECPYRVLPGVPDLLDELTGASDIAIGLGTGNIKEGAMTKLARGKLSERFAFGGFGDDAESRADVLRAGVRRGASLLGVASTQCRVVIIGDTTRDIEAANEIEADCILVETGFSRSEELKKYRNAIIFPNLMADGIVEALRGRRM